MTLTFEILFEFRKAADAGTRNTIREKLMGRLEGKSVVITGAGSGIGRAASVLFSREGAKLIIVDRTEGVKETAKLVSDAARPMPLPAPVMMTDLPSRRPMSFSLECYAVSLPPYGIQTRFQTLKNIEVT